MEMCIQYMLLKAQQNKVKVMKEEAAKKKAFKEMRQHYRRGTRR